METSLEQVTKTTVDQKQTGIFVVEDLDVDGCSRNDVKLILTESHHMLSHPPIIPSLIG